MKKSRKDNCVPVFDWTDGTAEEGAVKQIDNVASLPFAFNHVAIMPDCHQGYGMPIGGVFASKNVIVPNMVGVDIGCGVAFAQTNILADEVSVDNIKEILGKWRKEIPVGFSVHQTPKYDVPNELAVELSQRDLCSLGTLGGGNHFLELTKDDRGRLCVLLHSGSRNYGKTVCDFFNERAKKENMDNFSSVDPSFDLAFLPVDSVLGKNYIFKMNTALDFAYYNRKFMLETALECISGILSSFSVVDRLNCHHNYAALENHYGENVWVHRKGAIRVRDGEFGIIPGSMGTPSFIVRGLGNKESFMSASHGAGRKMSRTEANNTISEEQANESIKDIVFGRWEKDKRSKKLDVSESPGAYKDILTVMENQKDLVSVVTKLTPMGCVKG